MSVRQLALRSFSFRMRFGLNFVGCVKELLSWKRVVEDFAIFEETLQFHSGIFKRIAGVNDIFLTSSSCHPKIFVKEFSYFLMSCHQHCLGVNLLVQR